MRPFALLLSLALLGAASAYAFPTGAKVQKVEIKGNSRIERDAIQEKMELKAGAALSPEAVRRDIQGIFKLGFFEDVRFEWNAGTLEVNVRERPVISSIEFTGHDEFESKELEETANVKPFTVLNVAKIRAAQQAIAKKYEEKGYYLARADYALLPVPERPTEVTLRFTIFENEKVKVRRIFFLGNKQYATAELKRVMITGEGHAFSWAGSGGSYREGAFERDLAALAYFYGNEGYIEAKFNKPRVTLSQDRRYIDIVVDVNEGKQFYLGNVSFKGDDLFTEEDLRASFEIDEGDVFSLGKLQEQVLKLTDKFGDQGYAFANVIPRTQTREGTQIVDLHFDIERGEKVYWGKINVTGNTKTHDKVVRRELSILEGQLYNATERKKSLDRVRRLGFFGNDVNFLTSTPKGSTNVLDLEVRVSEKQTGSLNISAGYASGGSGFTFGGQVAQSNLFGQGYQLSFSTQLNALQKIFDLSFTDPRIFDTRWSLGGDLYHRRDIVGAPKTYDRIVSGGRLRLGREVIDDLYLFGHYKLEYTDLQRPINENIFNFPPYTSPQDKHTLISSLTASIKWDTRNNRLDPSDGQSLELSAEVAGLGGRAFQKMDFAGRLFRRVFWKVISRTNLEYGLLTNFMNSQGVPASERYVLGGIQSLRGYNPSTVGTQLGTTCNRTDTETIKDGCALGSAVTVPIGGRHKILFNQELEFPIIPDADIRGVIFFDAGNTWDPGQTGRTGPDVLMDYGWGIRWYSPLGPLRFEFGYPLSTAPDGDQKVKFNFTIAPAFL